GRILFAPHQLISMPSLPPVDTTLISSASIVLGRSSSAFLFVYMLDIKPSKFLTLSPVRPLLTKALRSI
ncbi:hypothetical protein E4U44_008130, partial [Claviceps purpurea]